MKLFKPLNRSTTAGYTLIEILTVVVIVAILAAIAAPSWLAYANRQRVNAVESDLGQFLQRAQQRAIKERQSVEIRVGNTPDGFPAAIADSSLETFGPSDLKANTIEISTNLDLDPGDVHFTFDHEGMVAEDFFPDDEPILYIIETTNGNARQCLLVATILGNVKAIDDPTVCTVSP